jgi:hypothetical protein
VNKETRNTLSASYPVRNEHTLTHDVALRMDEEVVLCPSMILLGEIRFHMLYKLNSLCLDLNNSMPLIVDRPV